MAPRAGSVSFVLAETTNQLVLTRTHDAVTAAPKRARAGGKGHKE